jgi:hypothetical protein
MEHKEIELNNAKLRVWNDGTIERYLFERWRPLKGSKRQTKTNYTVHWTTINNKDYATSRIIGMTFLGLDIINRQTQIDHIDRNPLNNNISNLRIVSGQQNMWNQKIKKGYSWNSRNKKWMVRISVNGKSIHMGLYNTEEEAHNAYLEAKAKYHIIRD